MGSCGIKIWFIGVAQNDGHSQGFLAPSNSAPIVHLQIRVRLQLWFVLSVRARVRARVSVGATVGVRFRDRFRAKVRVGVMIRYSRG